MLPEESLDYLETPARAERLQLLLHLVRNTDQVTYLRAPAGAGKTRFAKRLLESLGDDIATVWLRASAHANIVQDTFDQLGIAEDELLIWPDAALNALTVPELLMVIDDADRLEPAAAEQLAQLQARGGRVLLLGHGSLAKVEGEWPVQFVDLPEFELADTAAFLRAESGEPPAALGDDLVAALHRAAQGLPGPLLEGLREVLAGTQTHRPAVPEATSPTRLPPRLWIGGGMVVSLLLAILVFQDPINALFEAGESHSPGLASVVAPGPAGEVAGVEEVLPQPIPAAPVQETQLPPQIDLPELASRAAEVPPALSPTGSDTERQADMKPIGAARTAPQAVRDDLLDSMLQDALIAAESQPPNARAQPSAKLLSESGQPDRNASGQQSDLAVAQLDSPVPESLVPAPPVAAARPDRLAQQNGQLEGGEAPPSATQPTGHAAQVDATPPVGRPSPVATTNLASSALEASRVPPASSRPKPNSQAQTATPATTGQSPSVARPVAALKPPSPSRSEEEEDSAPPSPAPVEERLPLESPKSPTATPLVAQLTATPSLPTSPESGLDWLRTRVPGRYTLQLVGARDRAAIEKFIRVHRVPTPYAVFERQLDGRPWYSLVAGDYLDRAAAVAARSRLPKSLHGSGVWPRTFASVQKNF